MPPFPVNMAAVVDGTTTYLYYVDANGYVNEYKSDEAEEDLGTDYDGPNSVSIQSEPGKPVIKTQANPQNAILAATSYVLGGKREIRIYYRSEENKLCEICHTEGKKYWYKGDLTDKQFRLNPSAGIEAIITDVNKELKVYCVGVNEENPSVWYAKWSTTGLWHRRLLKDQNAAKNSS